MFDFVQARGFQAVVFGLEGVLLCPSMADGPRSLLFHRAVLDPREEPLSPLMRNKPGIKQSAATLLAPFFPEGRTPSLADLYSGYSGPTNLAEEIRSMKDEGLTVAVWDNCLAGNTRRLHQLIDGYYPSLFPRTLRFLSTRESLALGDVDMLETLWKRLEHGPDDLLIVTANPGQRDHALRAGMASLLWTPAETSLASALEVYLGASDGIIRDPIAYLTALTRDAEWDPRSPAFSEIRSAVFSHQKAGPMECDVRCHLLSGRLEGHSLPVRYKPAEDVARDVKGTMETYLRQIERGIPPLARSAMLGLMAELKGLLSVKDDALKQSGLVQGLLETVTAHVRDNRVLYVETAKVFHEDEWSVLSEVFREDDSVLDARYASWVDQTITNMREMSAQGARLKDIRRMVKERLVDDLILRLMEIEMTHRSLKRDIPHRHLFSLHHDARNRVALFTANIDDKTAWKRSVAGHTKTLEGWIRGLATQMARMAREAGGHLTFTHEMDAGFPQADLGDLSDTERESVDHVLTELIRNAVKYRRVEEPLHVLVNFSESEEGLVLSVSDNGVGIRDVKAVLTGEVREHPELAEGYGGGLVSVRRHVDGHDGWSLEVESAVGRGSRFTLSITLSNKDSRRGRLSDSGFPKI
jgi:anti-sigma regulatory factor (Ser/Thr protein kinase)